MMAADRGPLRLARLAAALEAELVQVSLVVQEAEEALRDFDAITPPRRELRGIAGILHDFYTGAERVFLKIAGELEGGAPSGVSWHRDLLEGMVLDIPEVRPPVLSASTAHALDEFMRFRHLFRHSYGFDLEWPRVRALLDRVPVVWNDLRREVEAFIAVVRAARASPS